MKKFILLSALICCYNIFSMNAIGEYNPPPGDEERFRGVGTNAIGQDNHDLLAIELRDREYKRKRANDEKRNTCSAYIELRNRSIFCHPYPMRYYDSCSLVKQLLNGYFDARHVTRLTVERDNGTTIEVVNIYSAREVARSMTCKKALEELNKLAE